ncbi:MAG: hypothetical protein AAF615_03880, partial [Pseudomonadota bacterium]
MKICFVDHVFHEKTQSNNFLRDILAGLGEVTVLHSSPDDPTMADDNVVLEYLNSDFDLWIFFQTEYVAARLIPLGLSGAVIIPMYDGAWARPDSFWRQFVNCRFISFSRALHSRLQRLEQRSYSFEYWPAPDPAPERSLARDDWSAFFWERRPLTVPNARVVAQQCRAMQIGKLHVHMAPDFALEAATTQGYQHLENLGGVSLTTSRWFENGAEFRAVSGAPLFHFAPRLYE